DFHVTGVQTCALPISSQFPAPGRGVARRPRSSRADSRRARPRAPPADRENFSTSALTGLAHLLCCPRLPGLRSMLFVEILRVAFQSIRANFFRTILTMLGIIICIATAAAMLAAGAGAQKRIDEQIASLGANILTINASRFFAMGVARDQMTLTTDDARALEEGARYLDAVVP